MKIMSSLWTISLVNMETEINLSVQIYLWIQESTKLSGKGLKFQPIRSEKALFPGF